MAGSNLQEQKPDRQDVRVRDMVRLRVVPVDEKAKQALLDRIALERLTTNLDEPLQHAQRIDREMKNRFDIPNTQIMGRLSAIEAKLEALMMYLAQKDMEAKWGAPQLVNISAGGILVPYKEEIKPGALLRLEILMQTMPPRAIICLAEAVRSDVPDPALGMDAPYVVAARFIDMDPEDKDRLVKRIFEVQRMMLRRTHEIDPVAPKKPQGGAGEEKKR